MHTSFYMKFVLILSQYIYFGNGDGIVGGMLSRMQHNMYSIPPMGKIMSGLYSHSTHKAMTNQSASGIPAFLIPLYLDIQSIC